MKRPGVAPLLARLAALLLFLNVFIPAAIADAVLRLLKESPHG
jgi:hypothetical protein